MRIKGYGKSTILSESTSSRHAEGFERQTFIRPSDFTSPFWGRSPLSWGIARQSLGAIPCKHEMDHEIKHTCWYSPNHVIDCMIMPGSKQLEADGCVLKLSNANSSLSAPDELTAGDFVKVRLWWDGEDTFIDISLAEVRKVKKHWIEAEVIQVNPKDRDRLKQLIVAIAGGTLESPGMMEHLLIRA